MKQCRLTSNFSKSTRTGRQNATVVWKHSDLSTMLTQQSTSIQKRRLTKPHNRPHMAVKSVWRIPPIAYAKKRRQTRALWFRTALFWDIESFTFPQVREWGNEQKNERGGASKQSKQCRANKWVSGVSERASRWASGPLLTFRFMLMEPQCRGLRPPPFPPFSEYHIGRDPVPCFCGLTFDSFVVFMTMAENFWARWFSFHEFLTFPSSPFSSPLCSWCDWAHHKRYYLICINTIWHYV